MRINYSTILKAAAALLLSVPLPAQARGGMAAHSVARAQAYRFELAAAPTPLGTKQHVVSIEIISGSDRKPVVGATITSVRLDMGPEDMTAMTAPVREIPHTAPGTYSFSFDDSVVWAEPAKWALTITATVKGEPKPITGSVIFQAGQ